MRPKQQMDAIDLQRRPADERAAEPLSVNLPRVLKKN
jgi:hypothetical protein